MATNHDVAERFALPLKYIDNNDIIAAPHQLPPYTTKLRDLKATSMRTEFAGRFSGVEAFFANSENTFIVLSHGYSYGTTVVALFWNVYAQQVELWVNHRRYSKTTQDHVRKYRDAVARTLREVNDTRENPLTLVTHTTNAVLSSTNRAQHTLAHLGSHKDVLLSHLEDVVAPNLHESTRRQAIMQARNRAQHVIDLCTAGVPPVLYRGNEKLAEMIALEQFTSSLVETPKNPVPLKVLRTAVEGYLALERDNDNGNDR